MQGISTSIAAEKPNTAAELTLAATGGISMEHLCLVKASRMKRPNITCLCGIIKSKTTMVTLLTVSLLGFGVPRSLAQPASSVASHFIQVTEDTIKPGGFKEYARLQHEKAKALKAANWKRVSIGLTHTYGPGSKVYHYGFYKSFEEIENDKELITKNAALTKALEQVADQEDNVLVSRDVYLVVYNPDISYQGDYDWAEMRHMSLIDIQLKAGVQEIYRKNRAMTLKANQAAQLKKNLAIYTNFCGMQSWQYLIIRPERSLKDFDELAAMKSSVYSGPYGDEIHTRLIEYFRESVASEREDYLSFDPALSYTTPEWAGASADFWKP
jgi:hypothetical protein